MPATSGALHLVTDARWHNDVVTAGVRNCIEALRGCANTDLCREESTCTCGQAKPAHQLSNSPAACLLHTCGPGDPGISYRLCACSSSGTLACAARWLGLAGFTAVRHFTFTVYPFGFFSFHLQFSRRRTDEASIGRHPFARTCHLNI